MRVPVKYIQNLTRQAFFLLSSSKRNLLEEIKAISIPEKNAEKANDINMYVSAPITSFYPSRPAPIFVEPLFPSVPVASAEQSP